MQKYLTWEKHNLVVIKLPNIWSQFHIGCWRPFESSQELIKTDSTQDNALVAMYFIVLNIESIANETRFSIKMPSQVSHLVRRKADTFWSSVQVREILGAIIMRLQIFEKFWGEFLYVWEILERIIIRLRKFGIYLVSVMLTSVTCTSVSTPRPFTIAILKGPSRNSSLKLFSLFLCLNSLQIFWKVESSREIILIFMQRFCLANPMKNLIKICLKLMQRGGFNWSSVWMPFRVSNIQT